MKNEEKTQMIIGSFCNRKNCLECGGALSVENGCVEFRRIIEMAKWKDGNLDCVLDFLNQYTITDEKEVYTNGVELVPLFRVKDALEMLKTNNKIEYSESNG